MRQQKQSKHYQLSLLGSNYIQLSILDIVTETPLKIQPSPVIEVIETPIKNQSGLAIISPVKRPKKTAMQNPIVDKIKAISIHAPHAYAICLGKKPYEYRNSPTKRRGWVLIHSSSSKLSDSCFDDYGIDKKIAVRSAIIGAAFITDCSPDSQGGYAYRMTRVILFKEPVRGVKGCQAIFWGHCKDPDKIKAFEAAIEQIGIDLKVRN